MNKLEIKEQNNTIKKLLKIICFISFRLEDIATRRTTIDSKPVLNSAEKIDIKLKERNK